MILNIDLIEIGDVDTEDDGQNACHLEAIIHIAFCNILFLFQIIAILNFLFYTISICQKRNYLITVRLSVNFFHNIIAEV